MFPTKKDSDSIPVPLASFTGRTQFRDIIALPIQFHPPEMGNVVALGVVWRYWEGVFVCGG